TEWEQTQNWTAGNIPLSTDDVLIPGGLTYYPSLTASSNAVANSIEIEIGASITANSYDITVSGFGGAWINQGTFNPGTGTVTFDHGVPAEIVNISGINNFYNISVGANTSIAPVSGCVLRIAGAATPTPTSKADWSATNSTVEWNGTNQNVLNPTGFSGNSGYYNLILSGSGTKTMPATALNIEGSFTLDGTATATAASALTIGGILNIGDGTTFASGAFDHTVGGNFDNSGTFTASSGETITLNGSSTQSILGTTATSFEELTINNSSGVNIYTDVTVNNDLTLTNGILDVGATTLTLNGDAAQTSGSINVTTLSSLIFGGTTALSTGASLFSTTPDIINLTINRTGGVSFGTNLTVNGILNLQSANPSDIIGALDMGTNTLLMGATATNIGVGDVTGEVKRTTILANTEYTFGNPFTSLTFPDIGTLPTEITLKADIGTAPTWKTDGIKRIYDISQIGGSGTRAVIKSHYLDSELNGLNEIDLGFFSYIYSSTTLLDRGRTEINSTDNWITLSNADFGNLPSSFGVIEHGFGVSVSDIITWDGSESDDWYDQYNWTPAFAPDPERHVIIPDATTTSNDPTITASTIDTINTIDIRLGGIVNAGASSELVIVGSAGAWENYGSFIASTGKVTFTGEDASMSGITNFYDVSTTATNELWLTIGSIMRIAGTMNNAGIWHAVVGGVTTVEYNGGAQTIVVPNPATTRYSTLILSGSGIKTMPSSALTIHGDFSTSGTASATAADSMIVLGNTTIGLGSDYATGSNIHLLSGDFENNGTFTPTVGGNVTFVGTTAQSISGSSTTSFDSLCINNSLGVSMATDVNVNNVLGFCGGFLSVGSNTLGINGTIYNPSGYIDVSSSSSLSYGGTSAIILNNNLFNGDATINNLVINRSGGVTLGNESVTVDGAVTLTAGTLAIGANTLTIAGSSPTRTGGNIDVSNAAATIGFTNTSAITLPASVFSGNVNNMTINGAGGVIAGSDITMNGILNLQSANPSSIKGSLDMSTDTLFMGASATTTGIGDVIGIVKRQHTFANGIEYSFGNQYTSFNFMGISGSTKPTWISCRIDIGTVPIWRSTAVKRFYSFAQADGDDRVITKLHYLDSELDAGETDESQLILWGAYPGPTYDNSVPRGKYNNDEINNWVTLGGMSINMLATGTIDYRQWGLSYTNVTEIEWTGKGLSSYSGDWSLPGNWVGGVPKAGDSVLIPNPLPAGSNGYPYRNSLPTITPAAAKVIEIEPGASISSNGYDITVSGFGDAWVNNGTFIPGTGTVIFDHGDESEIVNLNGTTNFNNLTIEDKTYIKAATNCITRIAGTFSVHSGSIKDFVSNTNTVEYNGPVAQTVINPTALTTSG
ncbi:hypothetical protein K8R42_03365, partial [bacterium]|nr:hypothetical protein [bacterium]